MSLISKNIGLIALFFICGGFLLQGCSEREGAAMQKKQFESSETIDWKNQSDKFWKERLTRKQFQVCRRGGTERPSSGEYNNFYQEGVYTCSSCGQELFDSKTKYDSKTGWPSFFDAIHSEHVTFHTDSKHGYKRVELRCSRCGAHLGHLFDDGPPPTQKRYCINSVCLDFVPKVSSSLKIKND